MLRSALLVVLFVFVFGCAPSTPPTASGLLGGPTVEVEGTKDTFLVMDWPEGERRNLATQLAGSGIVLVKIAGNVVTLLDGCTAEGKYDFRSLSRNEQVQKLEDSSEVKANLPKLGGAFGNLQAERSRDSSLDLAVITVGVRSSSEHALSQAKVAANPACAGATHFIRHVYVGAFAYSTGEKSHDKTTVDLFKVVPVGPDVKKQGGLSAREGDLDACRAPQQEEDKPKKDCDAAVRINVSKLAP